MPYRSTPFVNGHFYHVFNRGVEKRKIFLEKMDHQRLIDTLYYYQFSGPKPRFSYRKRFQRNEFNKNPKIVEIVCYCLMPNHFHLLLRQVKDKGIQEFIRKVANSYTKYFNTKYKRVGPLLQGPFKAVLIETEEQLLHLSRYIHLNPYVSGLTKDWQNFPYSSFQEFSGTSSLPLCSTNYILSSFKDKRNYEKFISDSQEYALELEKIKNLLLDEDHTPDV